MAGEVACREKLEGRWTTFPISRLAVLDAHLSLKRLKNKLKLSGRCWAFFERIQSAGSVLRLPTSEKEGGGWDGWGREEEGRRKCKREKKQERGEEKGDGGRKGGREIREREAGGGWGCVWGEGDKVKSKMGCVYLSY